MGVVAALLVVAIGLVVSTCGGEPAPGAPCARGELGRTVTLDGGDVLECRPAPGGRLVWELVGHNAQAGSLVWAGWVLSAVGVTVLAVGLVGIVVARYGRRRPVRRLE